MSSNFIPTMHQNKVSQQPSSGVVEETRKMQLVNPFAPCLECHPYINCVLAGEFLSECLRLCACMFVAFMLHTTTTRLGSFLSLFGVVRLFAGKLESYLAFPLYGIFDDFTLFIIFIPLISLTRLHSPKNLINRFCCSCDCCRGFF